MKCDMKTMLKSGAGLAVGIAVAYAMFPAARELLVAVSPFLFLLICPLMMVFMMKGMQSCHTDHGTKKHRSTEIPTDEPAKSGFTRLGLAVSKRRDA